MCLSFVVHALDASSDLAHVQHSILQIAVRTPLDFRPLPCTPSTSQPVLLPLSSHPRPLDRQAVVSMASIAETTDMALLASTSATKLPTLMSPRASSPLTPPATGEAKESTSSGCHQRGQSDENAAAAAASSATAYPSSARLSASPPYHISYPIRDSPRNPFLQGGQADAGLSGPRVWQAKQRMACIPPRERGKMTYVFRGQRVTYADPYASESDEEEMEHGTYQHGPYLVRERTMDRLQPRLLFPQASTKMSLPVQRAAPVPNQEPLQQHGTRKTLSRPHQIAGEQEHSKRRRVGLSADNSSLLERLDEAGWCSDGEEMDEMEEDEVDQAVFSMEHEANGDVDDDDAQVHLAPPAYRDSESEQDDEEEVEENPFLDVAPKAVPFVNATNRPISNLPSRAWHTAHASHQQHRFNTFAQRPRGHAHSLAHSMHIPDHLKCRRY